MEPHIRNLEPLASAMTQHEEAAAAEPVPVEVPAAGRRPADLATRATPETNGPREYGWPTQT